MPQVHVIHPIEQRQNALRVAAYARVSTDKADQLNSLEAQTEYFTKYIQQMPDWIYVDTYADEGLSGMQTERRDELDRLLGDCKKGKVDKIIAKSVTRLARNAKDSLRIVRDLKAIGVSVRFDKEGFDTIDMSSEMILMIWSSLAQKESESISENMRWSYKKRMEFGQFITCKAPYGYDLIDGKNLIPNAYEASIIQWVFEMYLNGLGTPQIAHRLNAEEIESPESSKQWNDSAVNYILRNEKYIGDTMAQKTYSTDIFPFRKMPNKGQKQKYYIKNSHPPIINANDFDRAAALMARRAVEYSAPKQYPLSKKMICGICGKTLKRRISKNGHISWACRNHDQSKYLCPLPRIAQEETYAAFMRLVNKLKRYRHMILHPVITQLEDLQNKLLGSNAKLLDIKDRQGKLAEQYHLVQQLRVEGLITDDIYMGKSNEISAQRAELRKQQRFILDGDGYRDLIEDVQELADTIEQAPIDIRAFDPCLFSQIIECIQVDEGPVLRFRLRGGLEFQERIGG